MARKAWSGSTRKATLPHDWEIRRLRTFERDGWRCTHIRADNGERCNDPATDCDHVGDRWDHSMQNLTSLCNYHHQSKSSSQGGAAAARKRKRAQKQKHPGII